MIDLLDEGVLDTDVKPRLFVGNFTLPNMEVTRSAGDF